jgi:transposase-like protein
MLATPVTGSRLKSSAEGRGERIMKRFKSAGQAQRFPSVHDQVANLFRGPANITAAAHRAP